MSQISTSITKERLKLGMTQSEFAKHINAKQSLVSRWEHGDYNFSIKKIAEIAVALDLDIDIMFTNASLHNLNKDYHFQKPIANSYMIQYLSNNKSISNTYTSKTYSNHVVINNYCNNKEESHYASIR